MHLVCFTTRKYHEARSHKRKISQSQLNFDSYLMLHVLHVSALQSHHQVPVFSKTYLENLTNLHVPKNFVVLYI